MKQIQSKILDSSLKQVIGGEFTIHLKEDASVLDLINEIDAGRKGRIIGVGNGDPSSHEKDKATKRRLFNGLCQAIVQSTDKSGNIVVRAESAKLGTATLRLKSE